MSSFNEPYRTDAELKADHEVDYKRGKMKKRELKNRLAQDIFLKVIEEIEGGVTIFTKDEMISLARGDGKYANEGERYVWWNACTIAVQRIRRYFWSDIKNATDRRMFNYVAGKYELVKVTDELHTNLVYEAYDRKMKGIAFKQAQLASSAYQKVLELDPESRNSLIKRLQEAEVI
jgi:hypothetical protein